MCCVRSGFAAPGPVVLPRVRVEVAVPVELEHVAPEPVGSRLEDAADHRAGHVADVGGVVVGLDADLRERVGVRLVRDPVVHRLGHVHAVEQVAVGLLAVAVDVRAPAAAAVARRVEAAGVRRQRTRHQQRQLARVAAVERQRRHGLGRDDLSDRRGLRLQDLTGPLDLDRLLDLAHGHLEIEPCDLLRLEPDGLGRGRPEPRQFGLDDVGADGHRGDRVVAGLVGDGHVTDVGSLVGGRDGDARQGAAGLIENEAGDRRRAGLRARRRRQRQQQDAQPQPAPRSDTGHTTDSFHLKERPWT